MNESAAPSVFLNVLPSRAILAYSGRGFAVCVILCAPEGP